MQPATKKKMAPANRITLRFMVVVVLAIITSIPAFMVQGLTWERTSRKQYAVNEVQERWGRAQTVIGPVLSVPYRTIGKEEKGKLTYIYSTVTILPDSLSISGNIEPQIRKRGIYEAILYSSDLRLSGTISIPDLSEYGVQPQQVMWDQARVHIGLADPAGIQQRIVLNWNERQLEAVPGVAGSNFLQTGVVFNPEIEGNRPVTIAFDTAISLRGSSSIKVTPVGKETRVKLESSWDSPSFTGRTLPVVRTVNASGFTAEWFMLDMNRAYPQIWTSSNVQDYQRLMQLQESSTGVELIQPVDQYDMAERAGKYAFLFICATYGIMFFLELQMKVRVHPVQYGLVGAALCLFYVVLIAVMEHSGFLFAYCLATAIIVAMLSWFTGTLYRNRRVSQIAAILLLLVYSIFYLILQSQDYALLSGTIICTIALIAAMIASTKINWYEAVSEETEISETESLSV